MKQAVQFFLYTHEFGEFPLLTIQMSHKNLMWNALP